MIQRFRNLALMFGAAVLAFGIAGYDSAVAAGSGWEGKYKTKDTQGNAMSITLAKDGTASADRGGEDLTGKWKEDSGTAVIDWSDEWTTKLAKDGDKYSKTAFKAGSQDGDPVSAKKIE